MSKRIGFAAIVLWLCVGTAGSAQQWARNMFQTTTHDFGALARGAKAEFAFTFENIYLEDAHVSHVRTSCGCTLVKHPTEIIKTYQKGQIIASVDTRGFLGRKDATITVVFDKPYAAEVQLHVHSYIRSDIVFQPGAIDFGSIRQGQGGQHKTVISYAGRDDWAITAVESPRPYLSTKLVELDRNLGRVTYELSVELKPDAPKGYLGEYLTVRTNDADATKSRVPLAVEGVVVPPLAVRPAALALDAKVGAPPVTRNLVVQGFAPFRVIEVTCPDPRITCQVPTEVKKFHVIPVTFAPGTVPGKTDVAIEIKTDLDGASVSLQIHLEVVPDPPPPAAPATADAPSS
ncbi:MAG: DUF1573 domain-containing protein [Pirellulales bacterium]|nr:DUF1573 domain-containing protein [Pirellulales bacterium]